MLNNLSIHIRLMISFMKYVQSRSDTGYCRYRTAPPAGNLSLERTQFDQSQK